MIRLNDLPDPNDQYEDEPDAAMEFIHGSYASLTPHKKPKKKKHKFPVGFCK